MPHHTGLKYQDTTKTTTNPNLQDERVSKAISKKVKEGIPQKQAVAEALSMARAKRLTKTGEYIPVGGKR